MASNNYNNENMGIVKNHSNNAKAYIEKDAKDALELIKEYYPHIDMTEHEEKAMLYVLTSGFIRKSDGQEGMIGYHKDRRDLLSEAKDEIEEAIKDRQKLVNNTGRPFGYGNANSGGRRRTLRKRNHRSKTRRNRK